MKIILRITSILLAVTILGSCMNLFGGDDEDDGGAGGPNTPGNVLSFDLSNATAVGAAEVSANASNLTGSSLLSGSDSAAEAAFGLVKIMEDGSVQMAMSAPENVWMPAVQFIATTPDPDDRDIYVSFENSMNWWDDSGEHRISALLHILEDGTYYEVLPGRDGRVRNYSWWGDDNYKPVVFDQAGNLYYVWEEWSGGDNVEVLYRYSPETHESIALTAQLSGYHYNSFQVSPDGSRLFVQGNRNSSNGGTTANFFRMYPTNDMANPKTVYYSSADNVWVRGYILAEDGSNVIMNGYGIRGINGIMRANIVSNTEISYDPLFDSNTSGFSPEYNSWYSDWEDKTYHNGLFDRVSEWNSYALVTNGSELLFLRFYDAVYSSGQSSVSTKASPSANSGYDYQFEELSFISDPEDLSSVIDGTDGSTRWSDMTPEQKDLVMSGYIQYSYQNNQEHYEFVPMTTVVRDAVVDGMLHGSSGTVYTWNSHWLEEDGSLDQSAVEDYLQGFFVSDIVFSYGLDTGSLAWETFRNDDPYIETEIRGNTNNQSYLLETYFETPSGADAKTVQEFRTENNLGWLDFSNVSTMFYDSTGTLWGVLGGGNWGGSADLTPIRLLGPDGAKDLAVIPSISDGSYKPVGFMIDGDYLYFRDAVLDSEGFELGYHKMYRLNILDPNAVPEDVLTGLGASNGRVEIVDFSIGGGFMYFTAVDGIQLIGGKINTQTLEYTPFEDEYVIRNIEVY